MPLQTSPLQNRADPTGRLFANASRGMFTGNRGAIHDPDTKTLTGRSWTTKAWIICDCGFEGRKREVFGRNARVGKQMTGGPGWTNLFFLDEVTALAAGHRPCFECRREKAREFTDCYGRAFGVSAPKVAEMDARLHAERWLSARTPQRPMIAIAGVPEGAMLWNGARFVTRKGGRDLIWDFAGYATDRNDAAPTPSRLRLVTPPTMLAVLAAGYRPVWHPSAD